ncbi:hypothetical protein MASR2M78_32910 [Treponema sp.]
MDIGALGSLYLKDASTQGNSLVELAARQDSSFKTVFEKTRLAEFSSLSDTEGSAPAVPEKGRPLGAAANSLSKDVEHASKRKTTIDRSSKLYEQCRELESFVVKSLLEGMRKTVEKSGLMDGGYAGEMYEDMLYDEYATSLSKTAGFGLADQAYLELRGRQLSA